jgi:hypothetical protein
MLDKLQQPKELRQNFVRRGENGNFPYAGNIDSCNIDRAPSVDGANGDEFCRVEQGG